jgi:hypothetical protein
MPDSSPPPAPSPATTTARQQEQDQLHSGKTMNGQKQVQVPSRDASRELDALIAANVMGWEPAVVANYPWQMIPPGEDRYIVRLVPHYSADMAAAWAVVEKLNALGYEVNLYNEPPTAHHGWGWEAIVGNKDDDHTSMLCDTGPVAICRAALIALGAQ